MLTIATHDPMFDSAWLKWAHGIAQVNRLYLAVKAAHTNLQPIQRMRADYDPNRHGFALVVEDVAPMPPTWGLIIGDIANNFRAALDQLAWALVCRGRTPPRVLTAQQEKAVYFPIAKTRTGFNGEIKGKLPGVRRTDIAKLRRRQPYHHSPRHQSRHPLIHLAAINNSDKHRTVQPVWSKLLWGNYKVTNPRDCLLTYKGMIRITRQSVDILQPDTEIAFIRARKTGPKPKVDVQLDFVTAPGFDRFTNVADWIRLCEWMIASLLAEFSEPPAEVKVVEPMAPMLAERFGTHGASGGVPLTVMLPCDRRRMNALMAFSGSAATVA